MKFLRYEMQGSINWGWYFEGMIGKIDGNIFDRYRRFESNIEIQDVRLLPPVAPSKIICIGRNYASQIGRAHV